MSWNVFMVFSSTRLQGAGLDGVDGGVVPVAVQARYFAGGVVPDDVGVSDAVSFALLHETRNVRRHAPAQQGLHRDGVAFAFDQFDDLDPEIRHRLGKAAPDLFETAAD